MGLTLWREKLFVCLFLANLTTIFSQPRGAIDDWTLAVESVHKMEHLRWSGVAEWATSAAEAALRQKPFFKQKIDQFLTEKEKNQSQRNVNEQTETFKIILRRFWAVPEGSAFQNLAKPTALQEALDRWSTFIDFYWSNCPSFSLPFIISLREMVYGVGLLSQNKNNPITRDNGLNFMFVSWRIEFL